MCAGSLGAMPTSSALRRDPVQGRSSKRVDRILEECALALDEVGYEGITTSLLAKRAGMSVGGLYRFFESKQAVVSELRRRRLNEYLRHADEAIRAWNGDWHELGVSLIDILIEMRRTVPGTSVLQQGAASASLPRDPHEDERSAELLAEALAARLGRPLDPGFRTTVLVAYVMGDALCSQAFRNDPVGDEVILDHAKVVVGAYLNGEIITWDADAMAPRNVAR